MAGTITTINPSTGTELAQYEAMDRRAIEEAVVAATRARGPWGAVPVAARADFLRHVAAKLRDERDVLAHLVTQEMGKPIVEARGEVDKSAWVCEHYAEEGPAILADRDVDAGPGHSWVAHEPLGVVLAVMPWNFPVWQVLRFAAPTLLAGNTALLKHAPATTGVALHLQRLLEGAGAPTGVFTSLVVAEDDVADATAGLVADPRVAAVSLTGSSRAGHAVAAVAGQHGKKSLLELGGSDPFVVLEDADLDAAVAAAVSSRYLNSGQSCLAAKRFVVSATIHDDFCERFVTAVEDLVVGDPLDESTEVGPLARQDLRDALAHQVEASVAQGATLRIGGASPDRPGWWYAPTVLTDVVPGLPVMAEETFGPVGAVGAVADDDGAVELANATPYGLGASVWSADVDRAVALGRRITSGALFVNTMVASDPRLPFGGTKASGYGRELGTQGLLEFVNVRSWRVARPR